MRIIVCLATITKNNMMNLLLKTKDFLYGKKTYILSVLTAVYGVLEVFGIITTTPEQKVAIFTLLGALFATTIRAGLTK